MTTIPMIRAAVFAAILAGLGACGGGGGGGDNNPTPPAPGVGAPLPAGGSSTWDQMIWDQGNWA